MATEESPPVFDKNVGKIAVYDIVSQYATSAAGLLPVGNNTIIELNCIPIKLTNLFFRTSVLLSSFPYPECPETVSHEYGQPFLLLSGPSTSS